MHLYLITRGIKNHVDEFITELQGKYFPFPFRQPNETKLNQDTCIQMSVRPIQLWELVYPAEFNDLVCNSIFHPDFKGKTQHKWQDKFRTILRKFLKLDKLDYKVGTGFPVYKEDIEMIGVGTKKDYWVTLSGAHVKEKCEGAYEGL